MENKCCRECGLEKPLCDFYVRDKLKNIYRNSCKLCDNNRIKNYRNQNIEKFKEYGKIYRSENIEKIQKYSKKLITENPDYFKQYNKEWYKNNKNKKSEYVKERKKIDIVFRLKLDFRTSIGAAFRKNGYSKKSKSYEILGCSFEELKQHIESLWSLPDNLNENGKIWMTWENKGNPKDGILEPNKSWDIDHIIPTHIAKTEEELLKLNHYLNLQPLCSYINRNIKRGNYL